MRSRIRHLRSTWRWTSSRGWRSTGEARRSGRSSRPGAVPLDAHCHVPTSASSDSAAPVSRASASCAGWARASSGWTRVASAGVRPVATAASCSPASPPSITTPWSVRPRRARERSTRSRCTSSTASPPKRRWAFRATAHCASPSPRRSSPTARRSSRPCARTAFPSSVRGDQGRGLLIPATAPSSRSLRCRALAEQAHGAGRRAVRALARHGHRARTRAHRARHRAVRPRASSPWTGGSSIAARAARRACARRASRCSPRRPRREVAAHAPVYARWGYDYWQQRPDGSIALGGARDVGGEEEWTHDATPTTRCRRALERRLRDGPRRARTDHASLGRDRGLHGYRAAGGRARCGPACGPSAATAAPATWWARCSGAASRAGASRRRLPRAALHACRRLTTPLATPASRPAHRR